MQDAQQFAQRELTPILHRGRQQVAAAKREIAEKRGDLGHGRCGTQTRRKYAGTWRHPPVVDVAAPMMKMNRPCGASWLLSETRVRVARLRRRASEMSATVDAECGAFDVSPPLF
jgi:hypothetical protein